MQSSLFSADLDALSDDQVRGMVDDFLQIGAPPNERPREGWRIDFKVDLSDPFFHTVAAFANADGGVILLGVEEGKGQEKGLPTKLQAVPTKGELRTRIANSIATHLDPWPATSIREFPVEGGKAAIVRVEPAREITMLLQGDKPVYVRDNDRSVPANARILQALIVRPRGSEDEPFSQADAFTNNLHLRPHDIDGCPHTFIRVGATPARLVAHEVDLTAERRFSGLVEKYFPRMDDQSRFGEIEFGPTGAGGAYIYQQREHRAQAWYFNGSGQVGFTARIAERAGPGQEWSWSIFDCIDDADALLGLAGAYWRALDFFGGGMLDVALMTSGPDPYHTAISFPSLRDAVSGLDRSLIALGKPQYSGGGLPQARFGYRCSPATPPAECLASVFNGLLRKLGHRTDHKQLVAAIRANFEGIDPTL